MNTDLFSGKAEAYAQARPSYSEDAIDYIVSLAPQGAAFADIGAGTGKFSTLLAKRGNLVYAVEPNEDMRAQLFRTLSPYPNARIIDGTDENTTLPAESVDVVTVAQALHWFDASAFLRECLRILRADGFVVAIYNVDLKRETPGHSKTATDVFFGDPVIRTFPNPVYYPRRDWIAYRLSHSRDPKPDDPGYAAHVEEANAEFDRNQTDGLMKLDLVTAVYTSGGKRP
ncbi:MAG: class I SAM-dependent methyltransferase [Clostridiales bacterium]|nr:class I SAM-dependent methyltransferase [Clostridiales bacterium]